MQKNDSIVEIARKIVDLREQLETVTELKEKAFIPCDPNSYYKLDELTDFLTVWSKLASWTRSEKHYGYLCIKNYNDLNAKFTLLSHAHISRTEFCNSPSIVAACKAVEEYIDRLKTEISNQEKRIDTLYNKFAKDTGVYSFIFKEVEVKKIIINKFLHS